MDSIRSKVLDDFTDVSGWLSVASGHAQLEITRDDGPHGCAMRLDFDFKGGGGFVVARKKLSLPLPPSYALTFDIRGIAPSNKLELKLVDPSGHNVWWYHEDAFDFTDAWRNVCIRSSQIEFAWGPAGGGAMSEVAAVELAIAAGPGGKGSVWISDFRFVDRSIHPTPLVRASSAMPDRSPDAVIDGLAHSGWRSEASDRQPWIVLDFREERELGGIVVHWDPDAPAHAFEVETSMDGQAWHRQHATSGLRSLLSYVYMPIGATRFLRLNVEPHAARSAGIVTIEIQPYEFSRSIEAFFRHVAGREPRGRYPKYLYAEQTYWSPAGAGHGHGCAILNEEGMVEVDAGGFSVEPFLFVDGRLLTWADVAVTQELERGFLPIPSSSWRAPEVSMRVTAFAEDEHGKSVLLVRYRVENTGAQARRVRLFVAARAFQVTPPWQSYRGLGGMHAIHEIACRLGAVWVDRSKVIVPLTPASGLGAGAFAQGAATSLLSGEVPAAAEASDEFGCAGAALAFDLDLAAARSEDVYIAIPFGAVDSAVTDPHTLVPRGASGAAAFERACRDWERRLTQVGVTLPETARACVEALRTATGHILLHRDGPALHPGPRRYMRAWIRDGAIMAAALLRMGCTQEACAFVRWYAGFQMPAGDVPCAVDREGPDPLAEHDSHGELIFAIAECFRFTRDRAFLTELWPHVLGAVAAIERLRATRLTAAYQTGDKRACYGLLPESVSHEGYLAHPVHSYYDDFWALRALGDAAMIAEALGDQPQARRLDALRAAFGDTLYRSIATTITERKLDYVPGSVEWADFDPAATTTALMLLDVERGLSSEILGRTYEEYLAGFEKRRDGLIDWDKYTAYEIRIINALVRLGRRASAHELLAFFLADRRPCAWNQWPEISWRDPRSPGHLGDVPHTWIAAEYVLAVLAMFAFERVEDDTLVLAAGISDDWLADGAGAGVENLPTYYGPLSYTLRREGSAALRLSITSTPHTPPSSIVIRPPLAQPLRSVEVDGESITTFDRSSVTISRWPADVLMRTSS